ncbi:MAG: hypothetical protein HUK00_06455 [Bacteroidaceae bacterium]|nr:hypothetical protein [Bacteroidaceae bacterium]
MKKVLFSVLFTLIATAAFAQSKTVVEFEDRQARLLDVESNVIFKPMVVEMQIMEKVGKIHEEFEFDHIKLESLNNTVENIRKWATAEAAMKHKADVIVGALFDVKYNSQAKTGKVIVEGYPAKFVNWHTVNNTDLDWIRATAVHRETSRSAEDKTSAIKK